MANYRRKNFRNSLREKVFEKFEGKCAECGKPSKGGGWQENLRGKMFVRSFFLGGLEIHHIKAANDGGGNEIENLILLCGDCHKAKHRGLKCQ